MLSPGVPKSQPIVTVNNIEELLIFDIGNRWQQLEKNERAEKKNESE